jgi:protein-tyrosine phosphatase
MHASMIELYRALPSWMAPRLRGIFERIAQGDVPVLVHCVAGKDRTGIAIALLLAVLDVPHETIVEDYMLTNHAGDFEQFIMARDAAHHPLLATPADIRRIIFAAHVDYLQAAFEHIEREHGGVNLFLDQHGIDAAMRAKVRSTLLAA